MRGAFLQKKGGEVTLTWPLGQPWEGERVSGVRWKCEWEMRWHMRWKMEFAIFGKMSEIQASRNDLKVLPKIKNNI